MRKFAFGYYVGTLVLVFFLYCGFLKAVLFGVNEGEFWFGVFVGALAIAAILFAVYVALRTHA